MQIPGERVKQILREHGFTPNPNEPYINPLAVEQEGDQLFVDINSWAVRCGTNQDQVPDCPVRIFLKPLNSPMGTVGLDVIEVRELTKDEKSGAEPRRDWYEKTSPWPNPEKKSF